MNDPQPQTDDNECGYCPNRVKTEGTHKVFILISGNEMYIYLSVDYYSLTYMKNQNEIKDSIVYASFQYEE